MSAIVNKEILKNILMITEQELTDALGTCLPHELALLEFRLTESLNMVSRYINGKYPVRTRHLLAINAEELVKDPEEGIYVEREEPIPYTEEKSTINSPPCLHDPHADPELRCCFPKGHTGEHGYISYQGFTPKFCGAEMYATDGDNFLMNGTLKPTMKICFLLEGHQGYHLFQSESEINEHATRS